MFPPPKARLSLEALDARVVPSITQWTGMVSTNFDTSANWTNGVPVVGSDVVIAPRFVPVPDEGGTIPVSTDCANMHAPAGGAYASVTITANYTGRVTLTEGITTGGFTLAGGIIDQPTSGTDITATGTFTWTGGTLNSTANLATVHIQGATGTINPGVGNTLTTGSTLSFEDSATVGSNVTITAGTINLANAASLYVGPLSNLLTETTNGNVNFNQPAGQPAPAVSVIDGNWTIKGGKTSTLTFGVVVAGELQITESSTLVVNAGMGLTPSMSTSQTQGRGIFTLQNGSTLQVSNGVVVAVGGLLQTKPNPDPTFDQADQRGTPAKIVGNFHLQGGQLTIDAGPNPHVWGKLEVTGNGFWTAGIMNLTIDPVAANNKMDQLTFSGTFTSTVTLGGDGQPVANSPRFNVIFSQQPALNQVWKPILSAMGGITKNGPIPATLTGLMVTEEAQNNQGKVPAWDFQS